MFDLFTKPFASWTLIDAAMLVVLTFGAWLVLLVLEGVYDGIQRTKNNH